MENKCSYCGNIEGNFLFNDEGKPLCEKCFISKEQIQSAVINICNLFNIQPDDTFLFKGDVYKLVLLKYKLGVGIHIPIIASLNQYHHDLRTGEFNNDIAYLFRSHHSMMHRDVFEMIVERDKIEIIPKDQIREVLMSKALKSPSEQCP